MNTSKIETLALSMVNLRQVCDADYDAFYFLSTFEFMPADVTPVEWMSREMSAKRAWEAAKAARTAVRAFAENALEGMDDEEIAVAKKIADKYLSDPRNYR